VEKLKTIRQLFQGDRSLFDACREMLFLVSEKYHEARLPIDTSGIVELEDLGISDQNAHPYMPVPYPACRQLLSSIPIRPDENVLIDFGCGKGRILCLSGQYRFREVIGVEMSAELCSVARENLKTIKGRLSCAVSVLNIDATLFELRDDVSICFFGNPFSGAPMRSVIENIRRSLVRKNRTITIPFFNPIYFEKEKEAAGCSWIKLKASGRCYPPAEWAIYEVSTPSQLER